MTEIHHQLDVGSTLAGAVVIPEIPGPVYVQRRLFFVSEWRVPHILSGPLPATKCLQNLFQGNPIGRVDYFCRILSHFIAFIINIFYLCSVLVSDILCDRAIVTVTNTILLLALRQYY